MSIASEITRITDNISDAYSAANAKGATMPATQNSDNLATTIATIPTGTTPTGSVEITNNGTYDVTDKATAVVNVPTTAPALYREFELDANGVLQPNTTTTHIMNFDGIKVIPNYMLYHLYYQNTAIIGTVDFNSLTTVSGEYAINWGFNGCTGLTSASFPVLTTVSGKYSMTSVFSGCTGLTSASFPVLTTISGQNSMYGAFSGCTGLTSMSFPALTTISASNAMTSAFSGCTGLTSMSFPALKSNSFGSREKSQFANLVSGVTGCTIHFPSNLDPQTGSTVISSLSGYPNFGGTNTVLAFDLPATE